MVRFDRLSSELDEAEQTNSRFSPSLSAHLGRWRTRDHKLLCQPIFAPHTMSVTPQSATRVHDGLTVSNIVSYTVYSLVAPSVTVALLFMLYAFFSPSAASRSLSLIGRIFIGCGLGLNRG